LRPGDGLLQIDGRYPSDFLHYMATAGTGRKLVFQTRKGRLRIQDRGHEDFGIVLEGFAERRCRNRCVFCFIDQLPAGLRPSLYLKDDDYRLSFLYGNYVTLTGDDSQDFRRIEDLHLSPLYVSVHSTDPAVRGLLLGLRKPAPVLEHLSRLVRRGIVVHCQIVLCGGVNDGAVFDRTLDELSALFPGIASVSLTPVGLTRFRRGLPKLVKPSPAEARRILDSVLEKARQCRARFGRSLIYPTDEVFLLARRPIPESAFYDDYCQIENGAGLLRLLEETFEKFAQKFAKRKREVCRKKQIWLTADSAAGHLRRIAARFAELTGICVDVRPVANRFFGHSVTVSGLLSGADIAAAIAKGGACRYVLPPNCLNDDGLTLDNSSLPALREACGIQDIELFSSFHRLTRTPGRRPPEPWVPICP